MSASFVETKVLKVDPSSISFPDPETGLPHISDPVTAANIQTAVNLLKLESEPIAFPTETVYGLGGSALSDRASRAIYTAKNRPADNPLIVHVSSLAQLERRLGLKVPEAYTPLLDHFWPGPLTIVLPVDKEKSPVSSVCTHGQNTVAVRMPAHPVARALIALSDIPLAAPSANASTRPSPTRAQHVLTDLNGRIPLILDGGACDVGLESTVVDATVFPPCLLRPGGVSLEQIKEAGGSGWENVVVGKLSAAANEQVRTPGMKYKHYSPRAPVVLFNGCGSNNNGAEYVEKYFKLNSTTKVSGMKIALLTTRFFDQEEINKVLPEGSAFVSQKLGSKGSDISRNLFNALREMDEHEKVDLILVEGIDESNEGLAVMNRLTKASSQIITPSLFN